MDSLENPYLISNGDKTMSLTRKANTESGTSLQVVLDSAFNGTTTTARLKQSNSLTLDAANWNYLPEGELTLIEGSNLLQTGSFTCRFIAIEILVGDATLGTVTFHMNFQNV